LSLFPPAPFSHTEKGGVGVLMPETGEADMDNRQHPGSDNRQHPGSAVVIRIPPRAPRRRVHRTGSRGGAEMWMGLPTPPEASAVCDANTVVLLPDADAAGNTNNPPTLDQALKPVCRSA
jgi:hypothetical protein